MWRLWCCVALVACGDNVQPRDPAVSGARLKLTWYAFEDGHRAWANGGDRYYDSVIASDCTPQTWADGTTYCTPPVSWIGYADAACTQRIGRDLGVSFAAEHVWSCGDWVPARLFRTGATRTLPRYWIRNAAGECYEGGAAGAVVDIGEELPVSTLAPVNSERTAHGEVGTVHRTSPDGLRMPLALYDTATGAVCFTEPLDNVAAARCIPYETLFLEDATTEACSMQPALGIETGCPAPAIALRVLDNGCVEYHALGETCAMMNGTSYLAVEGVIDMPALARAPDVQGGRRVHPIDITAAGARFRDPSNLFDSELGTECIMRDRGDGTAECQPYAYAIVVDRYSDAACTQATSLVWVFGGHEPCLERSPFTHVVWRGDVHRIGAEHTAPAYEKTQAGCERDTRTLHAIGDLVLAATLPVARVERDP